jgi:hypothetical protein
VEQLGFGWRGELDLFSSERIIQVMRNERVHLFSLSVASRIIHVHPSTIILHLASEVSALGYGVQGVLLISVLLCAIPMI